MKRHPDFRRACLKSTYFLPNGGESLNGVYERFMPPFKVISLYKHMKRHQLKDIERAEALTKINGVESAVWQRTAGNRGMKKGEDAEDVKSLIENTEEVISTGSTQAFEQALDEFINLGRAKASIGDMNISAANFISAIKVKADIEKNTKDRRLEMLRSMFTGAAPQGPASAAPNSKDDDGNT